MGPRGERGEVPGRAGRVPGRRARGPAETGTVARGGSGEAAGESGAGPRESGAVARGKLPGRPGASRPVTSVRLCVAPQQHGSPYCCSQSLGSGTKWRAFLSHEENKSQGGPDLQSILSGRDTGSLNSPKYCAFEVPGPLDSVILKHGSGVPCASVC